MVIFKKPGPAISMSLKSFMFFSNSFFILFPNVIGLHLFCLAKIKTTLLEISQSKFDRGFSKLIPL